MELSAKQLAQILHGSVEGDPEIIVKSFAKIENGRPGQLSFFANPKYEQYVYTSKASVLLVNRDFAPKAPVTPTMIRVENAYSAVAELLKYVADQRRTFRRHRGRCHIACSARIGRQVYVGDFAWIGKKCTVGDRTHIGENVYVGDGTRIGKNCILYPGVRIYPGMVIGDNVILHANCVIGSDGFGNAPRPDGSWEKIEHLGNVIIGDDVEIGANTTVDRAEMESTVIGNGVRIDNLCQIAHNVRIGDNTAMAAQCGIAGSTVIGKNCLLGGQVGVVGHLRIADNTTVAAKAAVIGHVRRSGQTLMGSPAIPHPTYLRAYAKFKQSGEE
ncbi:MAG: UDP-3-O-(3-hydroxymyristoyl)glucosamine N-acyltransferase [Bacteroidales bacterium]|nr:UDP-3-O-(3-hydroxymyristoyl)glucosamine N-acyltransferase [Bacteroidales bacterium]MCR5277158.1 UDP-3-O-(3-hydroxymyristoyl)glucosamine N-acyltransferase [Bacteroidales bacterium]